MIIDSFQEEPRTCVSVQVKIFKLNVDVPLSEPSKQQYVTDRATWSGHMTSLLHWTEICAEQ
jgi:hypothetical protein